MSRFTYIALRGPGERVSGSLRSRDRREAVRKLLEMGMHPINVHTADGSNKSRMTVRQAYRRSFGRVRTLDLAVLTRQMAALLNAGLPVAQVLATLRQQCAQRGLTEVLEDLETAIGREGSTLSEAMGEHPRIFDPVYRGLAQAGEEGGRLAEVLGELAEHLGRAAKLRGQVISAFIYPLFLLLLGTTAVFILMAFVIPKFEELFDSFGQQLPLPTRILIATSGILSDWWWAVLAALVAGIGIGLTLLRRQQVREQADKVLLHLPVFGPMILKLEVARAARTLAALLAGGVRILDALRVTGETVRNTAMRRTFTAVAAGVAQGQPLADAFRQHQIYPPVVISLIRTGEETGELPEMLHELSEIYEDEAERAVNSAVKLLEPALIVIMGLVIAGIVAAVILPIFRSNAMAA